MSPGTSRAKSVSPWAPLNLREYLEEREGKIWQREDTLRILERAEQIDALIGRLMKASGIQTLE